MRRHGLTIALAVGIGVGALAGCGGGGSTTVISQTTTTTTTEAKDSPTAGAGNQPQQEEVATTTTTTTTQAAPEPQPTEPPDVVGLSLPTAKKQLAAAGFKANVSNTDTTLGILVPENYTVCKQDAPKGDIVPILAQKYGC